MIKKSCNDFETDFKVLWDPGDIFIFLIKGVWDKH